MELQDRGRLIIIPEPKWLILFERFEGLAIPYRCDVNCYIYNSQKLKIYDSRHVMDIFCLARIDNINFVFNMKIMYSLKSVVTE